MKGMKKLLSILMVLTLVLSLGATAFAANVTIESKTGLPDTHQYTAYQIFKGTQPEGTDTPIGDIEWGDDIDSAKFLEALKTLDSARYGACVTAEDVAKALGGATAPADVVKAFGNTALNCLKADATGTEMKAGTANLDNGYYVIKDTTPADQIGEGGVFNDIVVEVTGGDIVIEAKNEGPKSYKKVKDVNDSTGETSGWRDSADYDMLDTIPYQLTVEIPTLKAYDDYYVNLYDMISAGLHYTEDTAKITITCAQGTADMTADFVEDSMSVADFKDDDLDIPDKTDYAGGLVLTWKLEDLVSYIESKGWNKDQKFTITVDYTVVLGTDAIVGVDGNPNTFVFEYKRNPNAVGDGHTPWDTNIVFTYDFETNKIDEHNQPLEGAEFRLLKKLNTAPVPAPTEGVVDSFDALKEEGNENAKYVKDGDTYWKVIDLTIGGTKKDVFTCEGIDDGIYKLVETKTPAGYNSIEPLDFEIKAEHTDGDTPELKELTGAGKDIGSFQLSKKASDDEFNVDGVVINKEGVQLPETGGIGTTIFYIAGAILVAGAVILLVTKKRVSGMEK